MASTIRGNLADNFGKPIVGATVQVNKTGTIVAASLFSDNAMSIAATNPLMTGQDGAYGPVFTPNGRYDLVITANGYTFTVGDSLAEFVFDPTSSKAATGTYTADDRDVIIYADASGGNVTINLPALSGVLLPNRQIIIIKVDSSVNTVTVVPNGADTINGAANQLIPGSSQWASIILLAKTTGTWASIVHLESSAPAANAVPVSGADKTLPSGWAGLLGTQIKTSGTSYTPTTGTHNIIVELIGGAGGGGGVAAAVAAQVSVGAGGGGGGYARKLFTGIGAGPYAYVIGAGGAGGVAGNNAGSVGTDTTFTGPGPLVITAGHGGGGGGGISIAPPIINNGNVGVGGASSNGDINIAGGTPGIMGTVGFSLSTSQFKGGDGGASWLGTSSRPAGSTVGGAGASAVANSGDGGAGAVSAPSGAAAAGGNGGAGIIIIWEFS